MIESELLERLAILTLEADRVLVLGAVSPATIRALSRRFPDAHLHVVDCSEVMLKASAGVDTSLTDSVAFEQIPGWNLADGGPPFDLIFSNLYLPLCDDFGDLFGRLHQLLKPNGCLHFSSLGPDSFRQLRQAWAQADADNPYHTLESPDMHDVGDALVHAGFREPVMDRDNFTLTYSSVQTLTEDLRNHGVGNGFAARQPGLTGRALWSRFVRGLQAQRGQDALELTVEIVIGQAWRGDGQAQQLLADGGVGISLESLAATLERGAKDVS